MKRDESTEYLFNGWYDFDDTRINPFDVNKLQKYFGKNKESAYILIYRKTSLNTKNTEIKALQPPQSLLDKVTAEEKTLRKWVANFESYKQQLRLNVCHIDQGYDFGEDQINPGVNHVSIQVSFDETLKQLKDKVRAGLGLKPEDKFIMVQYEPQENGTVQMASMVTDAATWMEEFVKVKELYLYHDSNYFVVPINHPKYCSLSSKLTLANVE